MKGFTRFWAIIFLTLGASIAATAGSIVGSYHDLSWVSSRHFAFYGDSPISNYNEVCVYCHTPHNATAAVPLWNRVQYETTYTLYSSSTLDSQPGQPSAESRLCLSCHDGVIAVDAVANFDSSTSQLIDYHGTMNSDPLTYIIHTDCYSCHRTPSSFGDFSGSFITTDLSNDHPVSITYSPSPELVGDPQGVKLIDEKVECPTCHNVHDPDIKPFLRISNSGSNLCFACHIK